MPWPIAGPHSPSCPAAAVPRDGLGARSCPRCCTGTSLGWCTSHPITLWSCSQLSGTLPLHMDLSENIGNTPRALWVLSTFCKSILNLPLSSFSFLQHYSSLLQITIFFFIIRKLLTWFTKSWGNLYGLLCKAFERFALHAAFWQLPAWRIPSVNTIIVE